MANHVEKKANDVLSIVGDILRSQSKLYNHVACIVQSHHISMPSNRTGRKYTVGIAVTLSL